jgi:hypothetical protein
MAVEIARILKVSTSPADIKYKFGIQLHKGIKNKITNSLITTLKEYWSRFREEE